MAPCLVEDGLPNWFEQCITDSENAAARHVANVGPELSRRLVDIAVYVAQNEDSRITKGK